MAIVVDEDGRTAGLVSLEDLEEELIGEITDEHGDKEPLVGTIQGALLGVLALLLGFSFAMAQSLRREARAGGR